MEKDCKHTKACTTCTYVLTGQSEGTDGGRMKLTFLCHTISYRMWCLSPISYHLVKTIIKIITFIATMDMIIINIKVIEVIKFSSPHFLLFLLIKKYITDLSFTLTPLSGIATDGLWALGHPFLMSLQEKKKKRGRY